MMAKAAQSLTDEPTTLVGGLTKILLSIGVFAALVLTQAAMIWLVRDMSSQNQSTSRQLVESTANAVNQLPLIAAEMRDDNRRNAEVANQSAEFMRAHTQSAVLAREQISVRLATIEKDLASIRADQQATSRALLEAIDRLIMLTESAPKNAPPAPIGSDSGA